YINANHLDSYINELVSQPFDLAQDHMLRAHLIKLNEQEHLLVVVLHHIATDGWSRGIMIKELSVLYEAYANSRPGILPALPVQYADYALWQREHLDGPYLQEKISYWQQKLSGVAPLQLPTDHCRPAIQSTKGAGIGLRIGKELTNQLKALTQQQGATLYMTLLAAFKLLLYRYSGQHDICVGTPIAGRQRKETEGLIGFFVNTLALRSSLSNEQTFIDLLQQVRTTTLEAYEHQDAPFEKIVETVVKERDISRSPIFQVMFTVQNTPAATRLSFGDNSMEQVSAPNTTSQFEINVSVTETADDLVLNAVYCTDLFTKERMMRMFDHYMELLRSITTSPGNAIGSMNMLTATERKQLLDAFNDTGSEYPKDKTFIDLFEEQVERTPGAVAVVFG
ncbi:MAG TPA: condensation domain-containing protein, partial [Chitinophagaceae bacterium]|nr:condensation domain-containing protein [Chitinophagaceae bacterium]